MRRAASSSLEFVHGSLRAQSERHTAPFLTIAHLTAAGQNLQDAQLAAAAALSRYLEPLNRRKAPLPESDCLDGLAWSTRITVRLSLDRAQAKPARMEPERGVAAGALECAFGDTPTGLPT